MLTYISSIFQQLGKKMIFSTSLLQDFCKIFNIRVLQIFALASLAKVHSEKKIPLYFFSNLLDLFVNSCTLFITPFCFCQELASVDAFQSLLSKVVDFSEQGLLEISVILLKFAKHLLTSIDVSASGITT